MKKDTRLTEKFSGLIYLSFGNHRCLVEFEGDLLPYRLAIHREGFWVQMGTCTFLMRFLYQLILLSLPLPTTV